jgi:hypothetical protein
MRRGAVLAAYVALSATIVGSPANAVVPAPGESAAAWLAAQPTAGLVHNPNFGGFDDYGLTVDLGLGLVTLGGQQAAVDEIRDALAGRVDSYTTGVDWGSSDVYAGATAKLLVFAQAAGGDPSSYGGVDLVARLKARVRTNGPAKGRIADRASGSDYANVIGQAFAVQGLAQAGAGRFAPALGFLLKQQCSKGYFRLDFTKRKKAKKQTCNAGDPTSTSAPDTDVTALAVLTLHSLHSDKKSVKNALWRAKKWLRARQKANGSFGGGTSTEASNANSTGLAGWALGEAGGCGAAQKAATWVAKWQVDSVPTGSPLEGDLGAVGYDRAGYVAARADGITDATRDQWRRATAQAAPALRNLVASDCRAR